MEKPHVVYMARVTFSPEVHFLIEQNKMPQSWNLAYKQVAP